MDGYNIPAVYVGTETILSTSGSVQLSEPLGPLLFALVLRPLVHEIKERFGITTGAYPDDVTLAGSVDKVAEALSLIMTKGSYFARSSPQQFENGQVVSIFLWLRFHAVQSSSHGLLLGALTSVSTVLKN